VNDEEGWTRTLLIFFFFAFVEVSLCPENFTRIGDNCYFFGTDRGLNWKSANSACKSLGAHLAEFDTKAKYNEVVAIIQKSASQRGKDFWLGGLNPGLLWIWSNAGKPVNPNFDLASLTNATQNSTKIVNNPTKKPVKQDNSTDSDGPQLEIKGSGRCLRLTWLAKAQKYVYFGQECSIRHNYLCELVDNTIDNEIKRIAKELKFG
jgi:Lectin C-type domain